MSETCLQLMARIVEVLVVTTAESFVKAIGKRLGTDPALAAVIWAYIGALGVHTVLYKASRLQYLHQASKSLFASATRSCYYQCSQWCMS